VRILFALPGLHRFDRGAEVAFISVAIELAKRGDTVTLIGSGWPRPETPYHFIHAPSVSRKCFEHFPSLPALRDECTYEELTFVPGLLRQYRPTDYDVTLTCGYPYVNWILRRPLIKGKRPAHVFVTENGDWPAYANRSEYRFFGCEGLICTNIDFYERNKDRWPCALIPNGVDIGRFQLGASRREDFGLPKDRLIVLMVSALIPTKRVELGIEVVSRIPHAHLVVAGDGPLRQQIDDSAARLLGNRFTRLTVPAQRIPALYQSADVFLHLSKEEAFGNVFIEALACGLPIVAHDSPRLRWIVGNEEFLVDTDDLAAIVHSIRLASDAPPACRQERSKKAFVYAWTNIASKYNDFLKKIIM
jgi:glycosyltransferase involved in cell wall biosynthesis